MNLDQKYITRNMGMKMTGLLSNQRSRIYRYTADGQSGGTTLAGVVKGITMEMVGMVPMLGQFFYENAIHL